MVGVGAVGDGTSGSNACGLGELGGGELRGSCRACRQTRGRRVGMGVGMGMGMGGESSRVGRGRMVDQSVLGRLLGWDGNLHCHVDGGGGELQLLLLLLLALCRRWMENLGVL